MLYNKNQRSGVLFGDSLCDTIPTISPKTPVCILPGANGRGEKCYIPFDKNILSRHIMLLGGIGTGKTNAFFQILSNIEGKITDEDVFIIFDTKGDFMNEFKRPGDIVISNDENAAGPNGLDYWNIFNEIDYGPHLAESVIELSKSLFAEQIKKTNQVFFPNAAKDLFTACIMHFIRRVKPAERTNKNLAQFICGSTTAELRAMLTQHSDFKGMISYIEKDESAQTQGVKSVLDQTVREIFVGNFAKTGTLSLKNAVRAKGGRRVFIEYDISVGKMLSPVYSLMFDFAIKEALSRKVGKGNVYFVTDEFSLLPNLEHVDDAVNFGRSLGIKFMIGIQNVEQIYENYGEERARSLMSGFLTGIMFRVNDGKSREYIQQRYGKCQKIESYIPTNQSNGVVETLREANVIEDWDVNNLLIGQAIIGMPNVQPFIFRFDEYKGKNG